MITLDYTNPEHKTLCEDIILAKRLKRIPYYSTYEKDTFFYDWGLKHKFWTRRVENVAIERQYLSSLKIYRMRVTTLSGILKIVADIPIEEVEKTGGF